ncbi:MAG: hypothetical protein ACREVY_18305, partial [Gammaproteobacteria bacterium]
LAETGVAGEIVGFRHLAVRAMPGSGKPAELLDAARISAKHVAAHSSTAPGAGEFLHRVIALAP